MNCHDVLPWLETGGPLQRRRAARHLSRCPKCRAAEQALAALKSELAAAPPLSAELRQRWIETADTPVEVVRSEPIKSHRLMWSSVAVAACLLVAVGIAVLIGHFGKDEVRPNPPPIAMHDDVVRRVGEIKIIEVDPVTEFTRIDERLGDMQADVAGMAQDAQRLLAQQQIERLLADHRNWLAATERQPLITP